MNKFEDQCKLVSDLLDKTSKEIENLLKYDQLDPTSSHCLNDIRINIITNAYYFIIMNKDIFNLK